VRRLLPLLLFCGVPVWAGVNVPFRDRPANAGLAGEWLTALAASARDAGLGNASVSFPGAASAYANPAGIAGNPMGEAVFSMSQLFSAGQFQSLAVAHPLTPKQSVGVTLLHLGSGEAEKTDFLGQSQGSFDEQDFAFLLSYGAQVSERWSGGVNLKAVSQSVAEYSATGVGLDAGVRVKLSESFSCGAAVQNLVPPELRLNTATDRFPAVMRLGGTYGYRIFGRHFSWTGEYDVYHGLGGRRIARWGGGLEALLLPTAPLPLTLRVGFNHREYSFGWGIEKGPARFDYAASFHELAVVHHFGISLRYGVLSPLAEKKLASEWRKVHAREAELDAMKDEVQKEKVRLAREAELRTLLLEAQLLFENAKYDESKRRLRRVLDERPEDPTALNLRREIERREARIAAEGFCRQAKGFYDAGQYREALEMAKMALLRDREFADAQVLASLTQAQIYLEELNYEGAEKHLLKVVRISPENQEAQRLYERLRDVLELSEPAAAKGTP